MSKDPIPHDSGVAAGCPAEGSWQPVHHGVQRQAQLRPHDPAVLFGREKLSYGELERLSNQLAHYLRERGVGPDVPVGVCMERSLRLVIAILGILKAGGAYVPLDPVYPRERLAHMVADSRLRVLLTEVPLRDRVPVSNAHRLCLDSEWPEVERAPAAAGDRPVLPQHLIYIIYTSGSTGKPKGAALYHRGFANLLGWYTRQFGFGPEDRVLLMTSLSFDLTQKNIFAPLMTGGRLVLLETPHYDAATILDTIARRRITTINCTPSAFYGLLSSPDEILFEKMRSLRWVFLGGEPISFPRLESWLANPFCSAVVVNTYGPTECTDVCAFHRLRDYDRYRQSGVPVGTAVDNTVLHILDPDLNPVAAGREGELCVGGTGVGAGYIGRPELTAEKFVPDPFSAEPGALLYRTGDWVRRSADGNIEFIGRMDHQVKVRGFRIEPGEIEAVLERHPALRQAVVLARDDESGEKRLVAYLVTEPGLWATVGEIRSFLQTKLPDYMLPTSWVYLDAFPLTPNGKIDRGALPPPERGRPDLEQAFVPPGSPLERHLARYWRSLLNLDEVGIHDRFFELGGTSIKAIQFIGRLSHELGVTIPIVRFFQAPTIARFSRLLIDEYGEALRDRLGMEPTPVGRRPDGRGDEPAGRAPGTAGVGAGPEDGESGVREPEAAERRARRRAADRRSDLFERRRRHRQGR